MPRNGSGVYSLPASYNVDVGDTIQPEDHETAFEDIESVLNEALPVSVGGTGSTTASAARTALSVPGLSSANVYTTTNTFNGVVIVDNDIRLQTGNQFFTNGVTATTGIALGTGGTDAAYMSDDTVAVQNGTGDCTALSKPSGYSDNGYAGYAYNGSVVGSVTINGSNNGVNFNTTSDERAKENIRPSEISADAMAAVGLHEFNFRADPRKRRERGILAQEIEAAVPEAVTDFKGVKMVDHGRFAAIALVSALRRIEALEADVATLKAAL